MEDDSRKTPGTGHRRELIAIDDYITELGVPKDSELIGVPLRELDQHAEKLDVEIVGMIRGKRRILAALRHEEINSEDILIVKAGPQELDKFVTDTKLELVGAGKEKASLLRSEDTTIMEAVVQSTSRMEGRTFTSLRLKNRYGIHLLGVSRQGTPILRRLPQVRFRGGDVVLLQGDSESLAELVLSLGCLPLAKRRLNLGAGKKAGLAMGVFAAAIVATTMGLASLQIALSVAAITMVVFNIVPVRNVYKEIDWPAVVLLGAMIPVGMSLESTGGTRLIAESILGLGASLAQNPFTDGNDQTRFLGQGNELVGGHASELWVVPTHQALHTKQSTIGGIHTRLIADRELASFFSFTQRGFESGPLRGPAAHGTRLGSGFLQAADSLEALQAMYDEGGVSGRR